MRYTTIILMILALSACSDRETSKRVVVEQTTQVPSREVVVERRIQPGFDGDVQVRERVTEERTYPERARIRRTETVTTTNE